LTSVYRTMLDTNIVSELVRRPQGRIQQRLEAVGVDTVCVSVLAAAELRYGAMKKGSAKLSQEIETILKVLPILPLTVPADVEYGRIRAVLTTAGTPIGPVDFFIAAHALALDLTLITANTREFARVPGLRLENWLD
jgi:tRNA(fMet)-specific endonuclease VapC